MGSATVFLVCFLFAWVLASIATGKQALTIPVMIWASLFAISIFLVGHVHLKKNGPQNWERIAQKPDRKPGMRLSRLSNQEYGQIGQGFLGLILAGPGWLTRIIDEWHAVIPSNEETAERLETLRQHLAARDAWVPMKDFAAHEEGIYLLARLNMLAIRELVGQWHFHVTVQGTVKRITQ